MNRFPNKHKCNKYPVNAIVSGLLFLYILTFLIDSFAAPGPPTENRCKRKWTVTNANGTTGMKFGDFAVNGSSGTITLNTGSTRTASPTIDLISAGGVVSSHQIVIDNTLRRSADCAAYGIDIDWIVDPDGTSMSGPAPGPPIGLSSVNVYINGVDTTLPTGIVTTYTLPLSVEITSTMTTSNTQSSGTYTSPNYEIGVTQAGTTTSLTGTADTIASAPVTVARGATMSFGTIAAGSNPTTVSVDAAGAVTAPAGAGNALVTISAGSPLTFTINGENGLAYNLNIGDASLDDGSVGAAMALTITGDDRPPTLTGVDQTVTATGDLLVGAGQAKGTYRTDTGSGVPIVITINYN